MSQHTSAMQPRSVLGQQSALDGAPSRAQCRVPLPRCARIGILHRADDARHPRRNQRLATRRRLSVMRTRFERDIDRRPARRLACLC